MSTGAWVMLAIFVAGYVIGAAVYPWPWSLLKSRRGR